MTSTPVQPQRVEFVRAISRLDATALVVGSMIGSGIFIVAAEIMREVHSPSLLLIVWALSGVVTLLGALSYGELAAMFPKAGGQYVYLREGVSPLFGYLYGWTLFVVIQTGTIAAVAVAFARFTSVLIPGLTPDVFLGTTLHLPQPIGDIAVGLSPQRIFAIASIALLTWINVRGVRTAAFIQTSLTAIKTAALAGLVLLGITLGRNAAAIAANFHDMWTPKDPAQIRSDLGGLPAVSAASGALGLLIAFCVAQVGSLFSSDAWNNITFTAGEVKDPKRNVPLSLAAGTSLVIGLYVLANVAYLCTLPLHAIQTAPDDRVATAALQVIFGPAGAVIMAIAIVISTFGCNNGLILAGARVYYAMARDALFFRPAGRLNARHVPAVGLALQGVWASLLVLPRTRSIAADGAVTYGNLYGTLLDWVIFAVLIFYVLTIAGLFVLRRKRPDVERPYRAFGYPVIPALYVMAASLIAVVLLVYKPATSLPGLVIVLTGIPVYFAWRKPGSPTPGETRT